MVTAMRAPDSRSTGCSGLGGRCVQPSFIFVTFASGSEGLVQSLFEVLRRRRRSSRASAARDGVLIPESLARRIRNFSYFSPVSRLTMLLIAAFASHVVASTPTVLA